MSSTSASKTIVERFICACNGDEGIDPWNHLAPHATVSVAGSTWFSGRFEGKEQIQRILLPTVNQYLVRPRVRIVDLIAEVPHVAALIEVSGAPRNGYPFALAGAPWGASFLLTGDLIASLDIFPDTMFLETTLCGAVYRPNDPQRELT